ncbi:MAG: hypothetical protein AB1847_15920 [bacterium]
MKKVINLLIMISFLVLSMNHYTIAEQWEKVADKGFDDPTNDYAWSMTTFKGKLYVGTLNFLRGAEIWSSSSGNQDSWDRVYNALSPLSNAGVRSLYADGNQAIYACTFNTSGAEILRSVNGRLWTQVKKNRRASGQKDDTVRCMVRFGEYLYGGAGSKGAQLYRSKNGIIWQLVKTNPGFDSTKIPDPNTGELITNNILIGEVAVFKGKLYAFTWTRDLDIRNLAGQDNRDISTLIPDSPGAFEVWRSEDGTNWEKVVGLDDPYGNGMGFSLHNSGSLVNDAVTSVTIFDGQLYLGTQNNAGNSSIWRSKEGTQWEEVLNFFSLGERYNYYVWRMIPFDDKLYISTMNLSLGNNPFMVDKATGAQIWISSSGDAGTFYNLVHNGFDGETLIFKGKEIPKNYGVRSFAVLNDTLFAGTATVASFPVPKEDDPEHRTIAGKDVGCEIWKLIRP